MESFLELIPDYNVSIQLEPKSYSYIGMWDSEYISATVQVTQDDYYYFYKSYSWHDGNVYNNYLDYNLYIPEFNQAFDVIVANLLSNPNMYDFDVYLYWDDYLSAGQHTIWDYIDINQTTREINSWYYIVLLTYTAPSYQQWTFPNPSMNGFLPNMNSSDLFKVTFGLDEDDWAEPLEIHIEPWWD